LPTVHDHKALLHRSYQRVPKLTEVQTGVDGKVPKCAGAVITKVAEHQRFMPRMHGALEGRRLFSSTI